MEQAGQLEVTAFDDRIRRSRGRLSRTVVASAKVTKTELNELEAAAGAEDKALSEWAREVLLKEARRAKDDALFIEVVAIRTLLNYMLRPVAMGEVVTLEEYTEILDSVRDKKRETGQQVMNQYLGEPRKEQ